MYLYYLFLCTSNFLIIKKKQYCGINNLLFQFCCCYTDTYTTSHSSKAKTKKKNKQTNTNNIKIILLYFTKNKTYKVSFKLNITRQSFKMKFTETNSNSKSGKYISPFLALYLLNLQMQNCTYI